MSVATVAPRGRVPFMGRLSRTSPRLRRNSSGERLITWTVPRVEIGRVGHGMGKGAFQKIGERILAQVEAGPHRVVRLVGISGGDELAYAGDSCHVLLEGHVQDRFRRAGFAAGLSAW